MNEINENRKNKLNKIYDLGIDPYNHHSFNNYINIKDIYEECKNNSEKTVSGSGRIMLHRDMGNLHFLQIKDNSGIVQLGIKKQTVVPKELLSLIDVGDIIEFTGICGQTKTGEPTVWVNQFGINAKCLLSPPNKHNALQDIESKIKYRHIDISTDNKLKSKLNIRFLLLKNIRQYLNNINFTEVDTPSLHPVLGGANAKPFITKYNVYDANCYLRIAPEIYLKRLLVAGFYNIFEISKNFRNEGISNKHNPEFTALELYQAYSDHDKIATLTENMIYSLAELLSFNCPKPPWNRKSIINLVNEHLLNSSNAEQFITPEDYYEYFQKHIEYTIKEPTFITDLPASAVPLAKDNGKGYSLSFELIIDGKEIGCGYTEENNPEKQLKKLQSQIELTNKEIDHLFMNSLYYGMPSAGGLGIGIERLLMWFTNSDHIRDVITFPAYFK